MPEQKNLKLHFPKNFLWGASISTHQVEGGNHNQWTEWELETAQLKVARAKYLYGHLPNWPSIRAETERPENYVSGMAADHYNRFQTDFSLAKKLNLNALRSGIEWSRIEPEAGEFDKDAVAHYRTYFESLIELGITPVITLWHWTVPVWFEQKGGFLRRRNNKYFVRYVQYIAEQLGDLFDYVIVLNEPTVYASMSFHERRWPPEEGSKLALLRVLQNLAAAHKKAYKLIKGVQPKAQIGIAHNCAYYYAGDDSWLTSLSVRVAHYFGNEYFINKVKQHQDFFGFNFYFANRLYGTRVHNPNKKLNDLGWDMQPDKLQPLIEQLYRKYQKPVMVTESGLADAGDVHRKWWIQESVKAMNNALAHDVKMIGYIHWSLLDNFEWAEGFWPRFGLIEVDYKTQKRTVRASALWYGRLVKTLSSPIE